MPTVDSLRWSSPPSAGGPNLLCYYIEAAAVGASVCDDGVVVVCRRTAGRAPR
eukprot:GDKH01006533.1.p5 GENE.GDKH01006533.1~~GDKH01006533.1.p5  ORF type:complete len:53 (+),score=4.06 GDKH01006533.1:251-409(+)